MTPHSIHDLLTPPNPPPSAWLEQHAFSDYQVGNCERWWVVPESEQLPEEREEPDTGTVRTLVYVFPNPKPVVERRSWDMAAVALVVAFWVGVVVLVVQLVDMAGGGR